MKNISAWAIRHPVTPVVLFVVLLFMGTVSFLRLPVTLNPDLSFPGVEVLVAQPGASPQEIETQIMQKVEAAVAGIGNIDNITSLAIEGQSRVFIQFAIGTPIDRAVADVRDAVAKIRVDLPQGIQEPVVQRLDIDNEIAVFAVSSSALTDEQLSWFVDNTISKRLLNVEGVAQVSRGGGVSREIRVELDPARMQALGITAAQVNLQLRQLNLDSPGGRAQVGGGEQAIRVLGEARSAGALGDTQIVLPGGRFARLSDLATVRDSVGEIRSMARLNGRPATTFSISKAKGTSDVTVMKECDAELAKIRKENPQVTLTQIFTTVDYTEATYHAAMEAFIVGSLLAVLVVFLFLRDGRATAISALAIPLSAIPTFAFMQWMDFTLNSISLLALSLVAGVLVDDAIVEIENIVRHMRMGKSAFQAALDAADEIGLAVVACSATIIAVFLPVSFLGGLTGQYFKQFGLTVAAAVFFSLLVARLITPVLAAYTLKAGGVVEHEDGPIMAWYMRVLRWATKHRWITLSAGLAFFVLSIAGLMMVPKAFIPNSDDSYTELNIELPPGARLEDTAAVSGTAYRILARQPEVVAVGECGLDYFRDLSPRDVQRHAFQQQLELAARLGKPVFLHERDAHDDFLAIVREHRAALIGGVAHCFTGTGEQMHRYLDQGLAIGITGWICDERRGAHLLALVREIPAGALHLETDAPYLQPRDLRPRPPSRRNEPMHLAHIARVVAQARGEDVEQLAAAATAASRALFRLPP